MGMVRFGAPRELILWIRDTFSVHTFVETGTNRAETAVWASDHFDEVVSVEGDETLYRRAIETVGYRNNVRFILGDSRDQLRHIVSSLSAPAVVWLDAHWCGDGTFGSSDECPVLGELDVVNRASSDHFILIDDARLFVAPPPAPHNASHWPDITNLCSALCHEGHQRYVAIYEDVIVAVPMHAKAQLIDFVRRSAASTPRHSVRVRHSPFRCRLGRLKRVFNIHSAMSES